MLCQEQGGIASPQHNPYKLRLVQAKPSLLFEFVYDESCLSIIKEVCDIICQWQDLNAINTNPTVF